MPGIPAPASTLHMKNVMVTRLGAALLSSKPDFYAALQETAKKLELFYMDIAYNAQHEWAKLPRMNTFYLDNEHLRLSFKSIGDTIPWEVVSDLAARLFECARRGMTDLFEAVYMDDAGSIGLRISLEVVAGSSDESGNTREGSVPSFISPEN